MLNVATRKLRRLCRFCCFLFLCAFAFFAGLSLLRAQAQSQGSKSEAPVQEQGTTLKLDVNLVQVPVTVRDSSGKAISNLRKEDFLLYDEGKLQTISTFAVETRESRRKKASVSTTAEDVAPTGAAPSFGLPDRFVALIFDDIHISFKDAAYLRPQAEKFLDGIALTDRIGIFSTSGQMSQDFTNDKESLKKTLLGLIPRPRMPVDVSQCPNMSYYDADQIVNYSNKIVFDAMVEEVIDNCPPPGCPPRDRGCVRAAASWIVKSRAPMVLAQGDIEAQFVYRYLVDVLRRLGGMPGERVMILASSGFLHTVAQYGDMAAVIELANQRSVVINTLDARGLYVSSPFGDISAVSNIDPNTAGQTAIFNLASEHEQAYVLQDFAAGTGGVYYGNSNDLAGGLSQLGAAPEVSYVLGFSPRGQKQSGSFHTLKVNLAQKNSYNIQARHGYFAPSHVDDPAQQAHQEIVAAAFSRDEILDLPLQIQTQFFKTDAANARLSVVSRIDLNGVHFHQADGWTTNDLTVATVIFDDNGNYIEGLQKIVQLKLRDDAYQKILRTGLTVKSNFDLKPGRYMVRQVARDSEGAQMAARSSSVEIPN